MKDLTPIQTSLKQISQISKDIQAIKIDIAEMKVDVRHHIKRSDLLEKIVEHLVRFKERALGIFHFIAFISALVTIYMIFH